jgi:hypothetical protein
LDPLRLIQPTRMKGMLEMQEQFPVQPGRRSVQGATRRNRQTSNFIEPTGLQGIAWVGLNSVVSNRRKKCQR